MIATADTGGRLPVKQLPKPDKNGEVLSYQTKNAALSEKERRF